MRKLAAALALILLSSCSAPLDGASCDPECKSDESCFDGQCLKGKAESCLSQGTCRDGSACSDGLCICGTSSTSPSICSANSSCCDRKCIDVKSDGRNCGTCGNVCQDKQICNNGQCQAITGACTDGQQRCDDLDGRILLCFRQKWTSTNTSCAANQMCQNGQCVKLSCSDGQKRCFDGNVEVCQDNSYAIFTECSPLICDSTSQRCEKPKCVNGQKLCDEDGNVALCSNGRWEVTFCDFGSRCDDVKYECVTQSTCIEGAKICDGNVLKTCTDNQWQSNNCGTLTCKDGQCQTIVACTEGSFKCEGTELFKCTSSKYVSQQKCVTGQTCNPSKGICEGGCTNNATECAGNIFKKCTNYVWVDTDCASQTCTTTGCKAPPTCTEGSFKCEGTELFKCTSAKYVSQQKCVTGQTCNGIKGICEGGCTNNATECAGNIFKKCTNYVWVETDCASQTCTTTGCKASTWSYTQGFEKLTEINSNYAPPAPYTFTDGGINWTVFGRTDMMNSTEDKGIDGQGVIMRLKNKGYIEATGITKGIGTLSFDYKSWGGSGDKGSVKIIADTVTDTLSFAADDIIAKPKTVTVNLKAAKGFRIETEGTSDARIIIDNVKWTNY